MSFETLTEMAWQFFKHFSHKMLRKIFILHCYIKNSSFYLISQLYMFKCICIVNENCIVLYFYTHVMLMKTLVEFFFFYYFFALLIFSQNLKYKKTWFLHVTSNNFSVTTKQNKVYVVKVHYCRFENFSIYSNSYQNSTLKISHS